MAQDSPSSNLKEIRKQNCITQERLAELINVHPTYISLIEKGKRNNTLVKFLSILDSLNTTPRKFFAEYNLNLPPRQIPTFINLIWRTKMKTLILNTLIASFLAFLLLPTDCVKAQADCPYGYFSVSIYSEIHPCSNGTWKLLDPPYTSGVFMVADDGTSYPCLPQTGTYLFCVVCSPYSAVQQYCSAGTNVYIPNNHLKCQRLEEETHFMFEMQYPTI